MRVRAFMLTVVSGALFFGTAQAQAATFDATAGPPQRPTVRQADFDQFFPSTITIHVGDTVRWTFDGFHTVSFLGGQRRPPLIMPDPSKPISGQRDAAGHLFWFNGQPNLIVNPQAEFPSGGTTYDGTQFRNSGLPSGGPGSPPATYSLTFTKEGTYSYSCLVHPGMVGTVRVVAAGQPIPSQAQDNAAAQAQFKADQTVARRLTHTRPAGNTVIVGPEQGSVYLMSFAPAVKRVHVGDTVTFKMVNAPAEVHTVTFGPAAYRSRIGATFVSPVPNKTGPPTLVLNPLAAYPSDPPPSLPPYSGRSHGNGFLNSGVLDTDPATPLPSQVKIKFTKPGVYRYECEIHPNMDGTVVVLARRRPSRRTPSHRQPGTPSFTG